MADDISKVAKNALRHFADVLRPEAICTRHGTQDLMDRISRNEI